MCHPKPARQPWAQAACYMATAATALPPALRPAAAHGAPRRPGAALGRRRRTGLHRHPARPARRRHPRRRRLQRGTRRVLPEAGRGGLDRPARVRPLWTAARHLRPGGDGPLAVRCPSLRTAFWEVLGERRSPRIVLEHSGADTVPTSLYLCDNGGMVVLCGGTTGYNGDVDLCFLWMRQKRPRGSHVATAREAREVTRPIDQGSSTRACPGPSISTRSASLTSSSTTTGTRRGTRPHGWATGDEGKDGLAPPPMIRTPP